MLIRNLAGNFFLLFPWGMLLPIIFPKIARIRYVALSAFCFSLSAETTQYVFSLGIFDIDDIILNTIGAITGFIFLRWIIQWKTRHTGMVNSQPKKYVNE
jgi:glycopeptide antibiotics resistance protein